MEGVLSSLQLLNPSALVLPSRWHKEEDTMVKWLFPPELLPRLRNLSILGFLGALALWMPHNYNGSLTDFLVTLLVSELGAVGIALLPWSDDEVNETVVALRAVRNAARSKVARLWSQS